MIWMCLYLVMDAWAIGHSRGLLLNAVLTVEQGRRLRTRAVVGKGLPMLSFAIWQKKKSGLVFMFVGQLCPAERTVC